MTDTIFISPETFALGEFAFRLTSRSQEVLDGARKLYLRTCQNSQYQLFDLDLGVNLNRDFDPDLDRDLDLDLDRDRGFDRDDHLHLDIVSDNPKVETLRSEYAHRLRALTTDAYRYHSGHLYIDGCALITDRSELVLLAGASHAGKTTLTVAAVQKLGWKILSEDLVLIDSRLRGVVPFINPLSLRPGALELIEKATGIAPPSLYLDRWLASDEMFHTGPVVEPEFVHSIILQADSENPAFKHSRVSSHEFLRALLPLSNALHLDNGLTMLISCIEESRCSIVRGGSVLERLKFLSNLESPGEPCDATRFTGADAV